MEQSLFTAAVQQHQDMVYRIAPHHSGDPQDAEDTVQDESPGTFTVDS
jgi:DNA-directed RNA polymerase specialized sigma24 family protein